MRTFVFVRDEHHDRLQELRHRSLPRSKSCPCASGTGFDFREAFSAVERQKNRRASSGSFSDSGLPMSEAGGEFNAATNDRAAVQDRATVVALITRNTRFGRMGTRYKKRFRKEDQ